MDTAWENFLEAIASLMSMALTDKEAEKVIAGFNNFQQRLQRLSSHNLQRLHLKITRDEKRVSKCKHEGKSCKQNVTRGFLKTWMIAYLVKYAIGLLPALLTGKAMKNPSIFRKSGGRDTIGFAFFLSSFLSVYKGVLCTMRYNRPHHEGDRLNAFVAGAVAGLTLTLDRNKSRRTALTLYLLTRSLQFASSYGMKKWAEHREIKNAENRLALRDAVESSGKTHTLVTGTAWDDLLATVLSSSAASAIMSLTAAVNLYAVVVEPDALPKSYYNFLMQHSGVPQKFGAMFPHRLDTFRAQFDLLRKVPAVFQHKKIVSNLKETTYRYVKSTLRSCLFLSVYVWAAFYSPCLLRRILGRETRATYIVNGLIAGLSVLIEAPGRQMELALYCLPRALETSWKLLAKRRVVRNMPHGDIALFCASMGVMMSIYQNDPSVINKHYLSVLTRVFGRN
ncbi:hypothetical protein BGZ82_007404 [Podila clonocystis]|nr:hypothetical protein BGZ82_007404 [Podila clonocystis]